MLLLLASGLTCQYLAAQRSTQLLSPTLSTPSLYLHRCVSATNLGQPDSLTITALHCMCCCMSHMPLWWKQWLCCWLSGRVFVLQAVPLQANAAAMELEGVNIFATQ